MNEVIWNELAAEPMKFKVELLMNERTFYNIYYSANLEDLFNQIIDEYPKAKIVSILGS